MNDGTAEAIGLERYLSDNSQYFFELNHVNIFFPPHFHAFYEIELITGGYGYEDIDGVTYEIKKGSVAIMLPDEIHSYVSKNGERLDITSIKVSPSFLPDELSLFDKSIYIKSLPDDDYEMLRGICGKISSCNASREKPFSLQIARECISLFLLTCLSLSTENAREQPETIESDRYRRALLYIHKNFRNDLTVSDVAREVYLAPNYFSSFFLKNMGISCSKYINKLRLELAYEYITSTDMTLKEIYSTCGYKSFSYFSNVFKNQYGHAPGYFRKTKNK